MDKKLGGLHKSDLLILAGRPSMGKTSLATNVAFNIAKAYQKGQLADGTEGTLNGGVVGFFSLEMRLSSWRVFYPGPRSALGKFDAAI